MGAWGKGTFDNDSAADYAAAFEDVDREGGLELITEAIEAVFDGGAYDEDEGDEGEGDDEDEEGEEGDDIDYLDSDIAVDAIVACEAIARLAGQGGEQSPYSEALDVWVAEFPGPVAPSLVNRALLAIDRIMADNSELPELWEGDPEWLATMADLRRRVAASAQAF